MATRLKVTQIKSAIGRPAKQRIVLKGLGLSRPNKSVTVVDTEATRGMIRKVSHLVDVVPAE